jgi:NAD(P)H dehydrogenase (quinone)
MWYRKEIFGAGVSAPVVVEGVPMSTFLNSTLGVTGASGHLGRRVVESLLAAGASHIVATTRHPAQLADLARRGVVVREASFADPDSLTTAFAGIDRLLLISTDDVVHRLPQQIAAVGAAKAAGVGHIAYTSVTSPYPDLAAAAAVPNSHYWTEVRIAASGLDFSLLRNNQYTDYLIPAARHAIANGTLIHAGGAGRRAFVTREDCAAAAAAALLAAEGKRIYDIGGAEAVTGDELARLYSQLAGRSVTARSVPVEEYVAGLVAGGVPEGMAGVLGRFDADAGKGLLAIVSGDVEALTGRKPQSVAEFMTANRAALVA